MNKPGQVGMGLLPVGMALAVLGQVASGAQGPWKYVLLGSAMGVLIAAITLLAMSVAKR